MNDTDEAKHYFDLGVTSMLDAERLADLGKMDEAYIKVSHAITHYDRAIEIDPTKAIFLSAKGFSLIQLGATLEAGECFEKSIELDPGFTESYYQLSLCFFEYPLIQPGHETFEDALALCDNKSELKLRFYEDLLRIISRHIFYRDDLLKMGHIENISEMTKKVIDVIKYAQTLDSADERLDNLLKHAESYSHTPLP